MKSERVRIVTVKREVKEEIEAKRVGRVAKSELDRTGRVGLVSEKKREKEA